MNPEGVLELSPEVRRAVDNGAPVVALESTIISHGMPYPDNLDLAREARTIIRQNGAIPATVAVLDGKITVGLTDDQLQRLAVSKGVLKVSRRDLAYAVGTGATGATTASARSISTR